MVISAVAVIVVAVVFVTLFTEYSAPNSVNKELARAQPKHHLFRDDFLCHDAIFAKDDSKIFFCR